MFNLFQKKKKDENESSLSLIAIASLLIHSAKIDEKFSEKEKKIIKDALIEMGADKENIENILIDAEEKERDSNQILDFTRQVKNVSEDEKKKNPM